jgi:hypothetical protein
MRGVSWVGYALLACAFYTTLSVAVVLFSRRHAEVSVVTLSLILLAGAGLLAAVALASVPALRRSATACATACATRAIAVPICAMAVLVLLTHVCVYVAIVQAPNAGYAQAIVNVSALLLALVMWCWFAQPLGAAALTGIVLITLGSALLKVELA